MILIALSSVPAIAMEADPLLATVPEPAGEITAVRIGSRVVYRYEDAQGHTVILDRPPPGHAATKFENLAPPAPDSPAPPTRVPETPIPAAGDSLLDILRRHAAWLVPVAVALIVLVCSLPRIHNRGRRYLARRRSLTGMIDRSGYASMHGVILPLAGGRTAFFHHIVRTPSGLLVLESDGEESVVARRPHAAKVPAPHRSDPERQVDIAVEALDVRVEAIKALTPGVPVFGRLVCTGRKAAAVAPRTLTLTTLKASLRMFREPNGGDDVILDSAWQTLRAHAGRDEPLAIVQAQDAGRTLKNA